MYKTVKLKNFLILTAAVCVLLISLLFFRGFFHGSIAASAETEDFIHWVDFDVPVEVLKAAAELDIETHETGPHLGWVDSVAYLAAEYYGDFSRYRSSDLAALAEAVAGGETVEALAKDLAYFDYYREAYGAVLGGFIGEYEQDGERKYGLKAYSPIAAAFPYNDYDDFGVSRSYGFQRQHLGHDMMAAVGTPVVAVESGTVEAMGWNQYGGWRIGIRSFDGKRYHYYAHLRQNRPYAEGLEVGDTVMAGEVIGYVGRTGYSTKENVNNIQVNHLHYGLQLVFDETQKEALSEIWIDVYDLCRLLESHRSSVQRNDETKEWTAEDPIRETVPEDRFVPSPSP